MHSINGKKDPIFSKRCILWSNIIFQEFSNFSKSVGLIMLALLAFLAAVDIDQLLILSRNNFKGPLNAKKKMFLILNV